MKYENFYISFFYMDRESNLRASMFLYLYYYISRRRKILKCVREKEREKNKPIIHISLN